ncbi:MAG: SGNH/GDSL hydrolase family protein [Thermomicrobiales bacterium]|nr:SGNH/GDSL hydrolase family protein [Thermomicrobiales bacterium]
MPIRGQRVVIVGDSLSAGPHTPGQVLADRLAAAGADVRVNARVGRSANNFYGREDWRGQLQQIAATHPDVAIVVLGTNDIGLSMTVDAQRMTQLRDALAGAGADVYAFGPPTFPPGTRLVAGQPQVVRMMRDVFGGDRFIDLTPLTADLVTSQHRTGDQVHFTAAGGDVAGQRMADAFLRASSAPGGGWPVAVALLVAGWFLLR